jgi:hypothetical protein
MNVKGLQKRPVKMTMHSNDSVIIRPHDTAEGGLSSRGISLTTEIPRWLISEAALIRLLPRCGSNEHGTTSSICLHPRAPADTARQLCDPAQQTIREATQNLHMIRRVSYQPNRIVLFRSTVSKCRVHRARSSAVVPRCLYACGLSQRLRSVSSISSLRTFRWLVSCTT